MTDKEKIRQEIERRINISLEQGYTYSAAQLKRVMDFIDSLPEESASEDLEEAALKYRWEHPFCDGYTAYSFKAGAEWQKQRDQETIELAEDHAMLAGMNKMKEEMMKNAVYGYVSLCHDYPRRRSLVAIADSLVNFEYAEKIKIIIVKEEG